MKADDEASRKRLVEWLESIGLDPSRIAMGTPFEWVPNQDGTWTVRTEYFEFDQNGNRWQVPVDAQVPADDPMRPWTRRASQLG